ncbi:unnamed protein product [Ambrosiozyma monospora]|uniref:Unnamed protein product n=1 Tax=Ambrosiozyma monospora TaxID=43982 RepID=A0ACB5T0A0_AMBMO|nr:unnamed protein product [Ambrosiozyma monospora]
MNKHNSNETATKGLRNLSCGSKGTFNRTPLNEIPESITSPPSSTCSALTIADPLVVYRDYLAKGILKTDINQYILAKQLQKLHSKLLDYHPNLEKSYKINELIRKIDSNLLKRDTGYYTSKVFSSFMPSTYLNLNSEGKSGSVFKNAWVDGSYLGRMIKINTTTRDLIKVLSMEQELSEVDAPKGLIINGEVGCGKSMLLDIFATCLPIESKLRIHYNNLILWVLHEIHEINKRREDQQSFQNDRHSILEVENELMMLEIAGKLMNRCHVLMLDEFMLPDLASGKIIKMLFTYYFKLGGVLVATSNRLPDDLYDTSFNKSQFELFEKLLKIRCDVHEMNSNVDYRLAYKEEQEEGKQKTIPFLVVNNKLGDSEGQKKFNELVNTIVDTTKFKPTSFKSYGRVLDIENHHEGIVKFDFHELCSGCKFGSSDFISLAARYHTVIVDNVPVLSIRKKNEARKFINLIDALYESRCILVLRTEAEPESLFFPERKFTKCKFGEDENLSVNVDTGIDNNLQNQDEEMYSKTQIALQNPYRPNVMSYQEGEKNYEHVELKTNFKDLAKFTGQDEMFAFKRAVSRIQEMCHSSQWRVEGRWVPNDESMRPWEIETETEEADGISHGKFGSSGPENTVGKPVRDSYSESVVHSHG